MNPYEILGVPKDADDATIHRAYRKASSAAHPDKGGDDRQMALVNMANDVLSDAARRKRYDETGETQERPPLEVEAQSALMQLFNDMMEKAPEDTPLAEMGREATKEHLKKLDAETVDLGNKHRLWHERLKKVVKKGGKGVDVFAMVVNDKIKMNEAALAKVKHRQAVAKLVLQMLDEYEDAEQEQLIRAFPSDTYTSFRFVKGNIT
jgi:curved DNA-binding protein CbpA